ncbi:MAG TPA: iron-sulfur cluster assembly scaffold protein [Deltaproteobacteria bacterium]|nr:iron-sulfur cluster assembly scaffold protein [Deltaproteobacteria bacterium]
MGDKLDTFIDQLQDQIFQETRGAYGVLAFERWQNMRYMGPMENPDGHAGVTGSCGDTMKIFLKIENDHVKKATFQTDGCGASAVCGSFAAEMALDKTPDELLKITGEKILEILGGFPKDDEHCAFLAAETLQEALNDYMMKIGADS